MYMLKEAHFLIWELLGLSFFKYPLERYGYRLDEGIVIIAEEREQTYQIFELLRSYDGVTGYSKLNRNMPELENYALAIYCYRKEDKSERISEFMLRTDCLSVLIVTGFLPEELREYRQVFRWNINIDELKEMQDLYSDMQMFAKNQISQIEVELSQIEDSCLWEKYRSKDKFSYLKIQIALAKIWSVIFRNYLSEEQVKMWAKKFIDVSIKQKDIQEFLNESYDVEQAVRRCVLDYIKKKNVRIKERKDMKSPAEVLWDEEFYYLSEGLLKTMCEPLDEYISFPKLKHELKMGGALICDKTSGNYTVKVLNYDSKSGTVRRLRFLKIPREILYTDEGMGLEDLIALKGVEKNVEDW